jgi:transposase-like protein
MMTTARDLARLVRRAFAARQAVEDRDAEIVAAHRRGMSIRSIEEATGIPHATVHRIIRRKGGDDR